MYVEPIDHSACSPDCTTSLRLVEDPRGYTITLRASRNDATLEAKTFHFSECLWTSTPQHRRRKMTYLLINSCLLMSPSFILSLLLLFLICVQLQSHCPPFICTVRRQPLSWHGNFRDNKAYPPWVCTTATRSLSHTSSTSAHQRQSLSTQWKVSSLAHASRPKLWWRHSSDALIWPWRRDSALPQKQVLFACTTNFNYHPYLMQDGLSWWLFLPLAQCPPGWLADGRSCYTVSRRGLTWTDAQHSCRGLAAGSHLADMKTLEDQVFISSHLLSHNALLLLWTGLNDQQVAS